MSSNPASSPLLRTSLSDFGLPAALDVGAVLRRALERGGDLAELFLEDTASTRIAWEDGKVDQVIDGTDRGAGLRIIFDNRSVYGYTTDLSQRSLEALASALAMAVRLPEGRPAPATRPPVADWRLARQPSTEIGSYAARTPAGQLPIAARIEFVKRADRAARETLPEARQVSAFLLNSLRRTLILNSDGLVAPNTKTYLQMFVQVVGEKNGRVESAYESDGGWVGIEFFDESSPESIGAEAARRVKVLLDAKPAPAGTMPVVLAAEAGGTMIHEAVGHGLEADLACNGLSVYQNKVGQQVASPLITVLDDGTMPARRGSYVFDDEGTPAQRNTLIENGVLKGYLVDRLSAMKFDLMATGNGRRESFRSKPIVRMTNTYIAPGPHDPARILAETERGIFVKAMGGGQVNTVTGDFVFAVTEGYLIEGGKLGAPIRGATLVGNGPRVLSIVDRVGTDLGFSTGTCGKDGQGAPVTDAQPTLRIPELTVGGEVPMTTYWK